MGGGGWFVDGRSAVRRVRGQVNSTRLCLPANFFAP